jgi:hypothetical protein
MGKWPYSPLQYLYENRFVLARAMFFMWSITAVYWLYSFRGVECDDIKWLKFACKLREGDEEGISARSAAAFILWALTSGILAVGVILFVLKFAYNCVMDTIKGVMPQKTHEFVIPIVLMLSLWPCFTYRIEIKSAYRTLSSQASEIFTMALGYEVNLRQSEAQGARLRTLDSDIEKGLAAEK